MRTHPSGLSGPPGSLEDKDTMPIMEEDIDTGMPLGSIDFEDDTMPFTEDIDDQLDPKETDPANVRNNIIRSVWAIFRSAKNRDPINKIEAQAIADTLVARGYGHVDVSSRCAELWETEYLDSIEKFLSQFPDLTEF